MKGYLGELALSKLQDCHDPKNHADVLATRPSGEFEILILDIDLL
jgi:hypothetical protein